MSTRRSNSADQAGAIKRFACILAMTIAAISLQLAGCSEELTRPAGESGSSLEKCFQLPTVDGVVAAIDIDRNGSLGTESLAEPPRIIVDPEMLQIPEPDVVTSATTTIIDFETPSLGSALSLVIDPYIDATSGVMFASAGGTLGLVKNLLTSACVDPPSSDQKLASGMGRTIGFSGRPIQAVFPTELPAGSTISVEIQALAGTIGRVTLFDGDFSPVGETEAVLEPPNGTCGYPGSPRARTVVSVTATGPVKHVRIDVPYLNAVMVIDDFSFSAPANYSLDIRPGSCPNPLNRISRGVLPVAIVGSADIGVEQIDLATVRLEGVAPLRAAMEDVTAPAPDEDCACTIEGPDGYQDLVLKFANQDIVVALGFLDLSDVRTLTLTGNLLDGAPFAISDCIRVVGRGGQDEVGETDLQ